MNQSIIEIEDDNGKEIKYPDMSIKSKSAESSHQKSLNASHANIQFANSPTIVPSFYVVLTQLQSTKSLGCQTGRASSFKPKPLRPAK